jgi:hypothetical protein
VVVRHTLNLLEMDSPQVHLVALSPKGEVMGAIFGLPETRGRDEDTTSIGWLFVRPSVIPRTKVQVFDAMVNLCFQLMRENGFTAIVTEMGSRAGQAALCRRHGFRHAPDAERANRWVKLL